MSELKGFLKKGGGFFADKRRRRLLLLVILGAWAPTEFFILGLARRTFVFYAISNGHITVEDRMIKKAPSGEQDITRYVEEAILGPVLPEVLPLFPKETRLVSLLLRDGAVYVNFSEEAALPPEEGGEVFKNLNTLYTGIKRNFPYVSDVCFFIAGNAAYEEFRWFDTEKTGG
jgi:hypothetical protein